MKIDFSTWTNATGDLTATKQRVLFDTLALVSEGKIQVVYGMDSFKGSPCLINAVGCMVKDATESPTQNEREVVKAFDRMCDFMDTAGLSDTDNPQFLTPIMAEFLMNNFAELKPPFEIEPEGMPEFSTLDDSAFLSLTEPVIENEQSRVSE